MYNLSRFFIVAAFSFAALNSHAVTVSVSGTNYEVTTVSGSYDALSSQLESQPWWNDFSIAEAFTVATGSSLGFHNQFGTSGPVFAYEKVYSPTSEQYFFYGTAVDDFDPGTAIGLTEPDDESFHFAIASEVPIPASLWLFGSALLGLGGIKRNKAQL